ncbi:MAG: hypothetical protein SFU98_07675 [Leptospiraceae bacterium]|nr:hypothetical protein [Leptospiraceae bacterium]
MSSKRVLNLSQENVTIKIGQLFRNKRKEKNITISYLAYSLGREYGYKIDENLLGKIERGVSRMPVELFLCMSNYFEIELNSFEKMLELPITKDKIKDKLYPVLMDRRGKEILNFLSTNNTPIVIELIYNFINGVVKPFFVQSIESKKTR